ncbi:MAG: helix-turn-helix domain-containing protein [Alphaproteobacteria bacterium]|nr:helix-turn-helix domain-containing protein [Alphaproteobacteria bacterium]
MTQISPSQLRAARALLNWSRADLSKRTGVSEQTIHRFENGTHKPETQTTHRLLTALEAAGIDFTDHDGVRFKPDDIMVFDGAERVDAFYDYNYEELLRCGGDVCANIYDETVLRKLRKNPDMHRKRMKELFDRGLITVRVLTTKCDFNTYGYIQFRCPLLQPDSSIGFYVFGDSLALVSYVDEASPHIVVIRSAPMAEGYRKSFDVAWKQAKPPSKSNFAK